MSFGLYQTVTDRLPIDQNGQRPEKMENRKKQCSTGNEGTVGGENHILPAGEK